MGVTNFLKTYLPKTPTSELEQTDMTIVDWLANLLQQRK